MNKTIRNIIIVSLFTIGGGWLEKEIELVDPGLVVALGSTAALALAGKAVPVLKNRGPYALNGRRFYITVHPSSLLRVPDEAARKAAYATFVADLRAIKKLSRQRVAA